MEIKDLINKRKDELKLTFLDIARACEVSEATVSRWASGEIGDMKRSRIASLAKVLKISPSLLIGDIDENHVSIQLPIPTHVISIPIYEAISCGTGGFVEDNIIDTITIPAEMLKNPSKEFFGQYASGDSMVEADINDGDLLIFEKNNFIEKGEIGCFCIDDNIATCKKYTIAEDNVIYLVPANSNYAPIRVDVTNEAFRVVGKLATKISKQK